MELVIFKFKMSLFDLMSTMRRGENRNNNIAKISINAMQKILTVNHLSKLL